MDFSSWLQFHAAAIIVLATVALVLVTIVYVFLTKKILDSTIKHSKLILNPVIGIKVGKIAIGEEFGPKRRNMDADIELINIGNAPAIEILVDAEIILEHVKIEGERTIPGRFEPKMIPFIRPEEKALSDTACFGNTLINHLVEDFYECSRLNIHRIETDPTEEPFDASKLRIIVYYRNSIGQYFESRFETYLILIERPGTKILRPKETAELIQVNIPRQIFHAGPIEKKQMDLHINIRNKKRDLCGW